MGMESVTFPHFSLDMVPKGGGGGGLWSPGSQLFLLWSPEPYHFTDWSPDSFLAVEPGAQHFQVWSFEFPDCIDS